MANCKALAVRGEDRMTPEDPQWIRQRFQERLQERLTLVEL